MSSTRQAAAFDEVFDAAGAPRAYAEPLVAELERLGAENLVAAGALRDAIFMRQGITFDLTSADGEMVDRPFPLDLVPRIIPGAEWQTIKRGLAQRIRALNQFVDDVYHEREIIKAGIVPWTLVASRSHFARAAHGIRPPRGVYTHVAGCDLVRDAARRLEGARGQRPHPVGDLVHAREPDRDDAADPVAVLLLPGSPGRPVPGAAARRAALGRAGRRRRRDDRRVDAGRRQQRLLRAHLPRPPDGRRAGRGLRPRRPRRRLLHAHDERPGARQRDLPPARRRLHRPARVPPRLAARGSRA